VVIIWYQINRIWLMAHFFKSALKFNSLSKKTAITCCSRGVFKTFWTPLVNKRSSLLFQLCNIIQNVFLLAWRWLSRKAYEKLRDCYLYQDGFRFCLFVGMVCLSVSRITQKVMDKFSYSLKWYALSRKTIDYILGEMRIVFAYSSCTVFDRQAVEN